MYKRNCLGLLAVAILLAACAPRANAGGTPTSTWLPGTQSNGHPAPATGQPPEGYPGQTPAPTGDPARATALVQTEIAQATATTAALLQTLSAEANARPTALSVATATPPTETLPVPPTIVVLNSRPECVPGPTYSRCHDALLSVTFDYPSAWGTISAQYFHGGYAGHGYQYDFSVPNLTAWAGGRSRDFSEGRGAFYTDFMGFEPGPSAVQVLCQNYGAVICQAVQSSVVVLLRLPLAASVCNAPGAFIDAPIGLVAINLPQHPKINGFVFAARIISDSAWADLASILSLNDENGANTDLKCRDASLRQQYDARVKSLSGRLQSGTAESGAQAHFNQLMHLAQSIRID